MTIDSWARVHEGARLGDGVEVGPFAVIGPDVTIGDGCEIAAGAVIEGHTTIGRENRIHPHAVIGGAPQDLKYRGEPTTLEIGDRNVIREGVTMNVGTTGGGGITRIGSDGLVMAYAHVAHDCRVGDGVILGNNTLLAGHVVVQDGVILNGGAAVHHFTTLGRCAYIGGLSRLVQDVPPFLVVEGHPIRLGGVNVIGLRRRGFPEDRIEAIRAAYRRLFRGDAPRSRVTEELRSEWDDLVPEVREMVEFVEATARGSHGRALEAHRG
jgi:UDP-N-acetylglucosamine acyltransferase